MRPMLQQWHVDNVQHLWVAAVLVSPLLLGDFFSWPSAHRSDPWSDAGRIDFTTSHAAAPGLPRIGEAYDPFDDWHGLFNLSKKSFLGLHPASAFLCQADDLGPALHEAVIG